MKINYLLPLLAFVIIVLLGLNVLQCSSGEKEQKHRTVENDMWQDVYDRTVQEAKSARRRADSLQAIFVLRRASDSVALAGLKMRNKAMSGNVQKLREPVQTLIDSIKALGRFVEAYDSLLAGKNNELQETETRLNGQITDLTFQLEARADEILSEKEVSKALETRLATVLQERDSETKRADKATKGKKLRNILIVGLFGYIVVDGLIDTIK